jgi:hypothetical protein
VSGVGNADRGDIGLAGLYLTFAPRDRVSTRLASTDAFDDVAGGCLGGGSRQPPAVDRAGGRVNKLDRAGGRVNKLDRAGGRVNKLDRARGRTDKGRPQAVPPDQGSIAGGPPGSRSTAGRADQSRPQAVPRIRLDHRRSRGSGPWSFGVITRQEADLEVIEGAVVDACADVVNQPHDESLVVDRAER